MFAPGAAGAGGQVGGFGSMLYAAPHANAKPGSQPQQPLRYTQSFLHNVYGDLLASVPAGRHLAIPPGVQTHVIDHIYPELQPGEKRSFLWMVLVQMCAEVQVALKEGGSTNPRPSPLV